MQDWEWEIADHARIDSFVDLYTSGDLSDDERFSLMEIILQSSEEHPAELAAQPRWAEIDDLLRANSQLHAATIYYWSMFDTEPGDDSVWRVTPTMRSIIRDHPAIFPTP